MLSKSGKMNNLSTTGTKLSLDQQSKLFQMAFSKTPITPEILAAQPNEVQKEWSNLCKVSQKSQHVAANKSKIARGSLSLKRKKTGEYNLLFSYIKQLHFISILNVSTYST